MGDDRVDILMGMLNLMQERIDVLDTRTLKMNDILGGALENDSNILEYIHNLETRIRLMLEFIIVGNPENALRLFEVEQHGGSNIQDLDAC